MAVEETVMDDRGRVTIGKKAGDMYGGKFFVVFLPNEILLVPRPKNPIAELREWGKNARIRNMPSDKVAELAKEQAYKEIKQRIKRRATG